MPTIEHLKSLDFGELAQTIRMELGPTNSGHAPRLPEETIREWISVLESKSPPPPQPPKLLNLPAPPQLPEEPRVPYSRKLLELSQDPVWRRWAHFKNRRLSEHKAKVAEVERQNDLVRKRWTADMVSWRSSKELLARIVNTLRRECEAAFHSSLWLAAVRVPWRFLPPSEAGELSMLSALHDFHRQCPEIRIDESRLRYAYSLRPEQIFIGEDEFDGYFAFVFAGGIRVLLENPIEGNAAYVFGQDWRLLSKLSKSELLAYPRDRFIRVVHSPHWRSDIKQALENQRSQQREDSDSSDA